jgi:hypothetical protein
MMESSSVWCRLSRDQENLDAGWWFTQRVAQARSASGVHVARIGCHLTTLRVSRLQVPIDVRHRRLEAPGNPDLHQAERFVFKTALINDSSTFQSSH